jgi:archaellum component FlaC
MVDDTTERLVRVETSLEKMALQVERVADGLNSLIRLEERQIEDRKAMGRCFERLERIDTKISNLETQAALSSNDIKKTGGWVDKGLLIFAGAALAFVAKKTGLL